MGFVVRRRERLPCQLGRGVFPSQPSLTYSLPPRKKGRPESAGQKKSQQTKKKQIKSTIIKHRCYKENKLRKIYWFLTKLDVCGKAIRSSSQVQPSRRVSLRLATRLQRLLPRRYTQESPATAQGPLPLQRYVTDGYNLIHHYFIYGHY